VQPYKGVVASRHHDPDIRYDFLVIDRYLKEVDAGLSRVTKGQVPTSSGTSLGGVTSHHVLLDLTNFDDHTQYLYLAGRTGGQTVLTTATASPGLVVKAAATTSAASIFEVIDTASTVIMNSGINATGAFLQVGDSQPSGTTSRILLQHAAAFGAKIDVFNGGSIRFPAYVQLWDSNPLLQLEARDTSGWTDSVGTSVLGLSNSTRSLRTIIAGTGLSIANRIGVWSSRTTISNASTIGSVPVPGTSMLDISNSQTATDSLLRLIPHSSQSAGIFVVRDSSDTNNLINMGPNGKTIISPNADIVALTLQRSTDGAPTAHMQDWAKHAGTVVTYIGPHGELNVAPDADITAITTTQPVGGSAKLMSIFDSSGSGTIFAVQGDVLAADLPAFTVFCQNLRIGNSGLGAGSSAIISTNSIATADRTFSLPDNNGQFVIRVGSANVSPRTTSTSGTLVSTGNNPSGQAWLVNAHGITTVGGTGNVQVSVTYTDPFGAKTYPLFTIDMSQGTGIAGTSFGSIVVQTAASSAITYTATVTTTGTYRLHIRAAGL
jgi:hypothetical protein